MTTEMLRSSTISEIVTQLPGTITVFEEMNIDFCCNGKIPFPEACQKANRSEEEVLAALRESPPRGTPVIRPQDWSLDLLTNYIVQNHHQYVKRMLPELENLANKVLAKHGARHPELEEVRSLLHTLAMELQTHLYKEEHVFFAAVNALVRESTRVLPSVEPYAKSMSNLTPIIATMETEHDLAGHYLHRIREITNHFTPPADACLSYITLFRRMHEFEADLHIHIHLENNLLFPKTVALQARQQEKPLYVN